MRVLISITTERNISTVHVSSDGKPVCVIDEKEFLKVIGCKGFVDYERGKTIFNVKEAELRERCREWLYPVQGGGLF